MPDNPYIAVTYCGTTQPEPLILSLREYVEMTDAILGHHDVAKYNLACTEGFPDEPTATQWQQVSGTVLREICLGKRFLTPVSPTGMALAYAKGAPLYAVKIGEAVLDFL
jgi:hypothetical protein